MTKKLTGLHPLAYMGVNSEKPPNLSTHNRDPLTTDYQGFEIGSLWVRPVVNRIYMLTDKTAGIATWLELSTSSGGDDVESLIADDGLHAQPDVAGDITIIGGTNVTTSANIPNQLRVDLNDDVVISGYLTATGNISTEGVLNLEKTDSGSTEGVIAADGDRFIHNYSPLNKSAYVGIEAGNIDPLATGESNTGMGYRSLKYHTTGGTNTAYGANSLRRLVTGTDNIALGNESGVNYLGTEASNIVIGSRGTTADANKIRIGTDGSGVGEQDSCAIAGIYGVTPAGAANQSVIVNADGELGSEAGSAGNAVPVGSITRYDGTLPAGTSWLACDGSVVSQATYADLFARIGHKYLYPAFTPQVTTFTGIIYGVAHNGLAGADGLWVAVGGTGVVGEIETSPDGITWTSRVSPITGDLYAVSHNGLTGVDGLWVIGGKDQVSVATSPDGVTWTPVAHNLAFWCTVISHNKLAGVSGLWFIGGVTESFSTSPDGVTFTGPGHISGTTNIAALIYFDSKWYAMSGAHIFVTINNGASWTNSYYIESCYHYNPYFSSAANSSSLIIAGNYLQGNCDPIAYSSDGVFWNTDPCLTGYRYYPKCITYGGGIFISGMYGGYISKSFNGTDWEKIGDSFSTFQGIASNGYTSPDTKWVTVGTSHQLTLGIPAINTATEFYLPNIEDQVILF